MNTVEKRLHTLTEKAINDTYWFAPSWSTKDVKLKDIHDYKSNIGLDMNVCNSDLVIWGFGRLRDPYIYPRILGRIVYSNLCNYNPILLALANLDICNENEKGRYVNRFTEELIANKNWLNASKVDFNNFSLDGLNEICFDFAKEMIGTGCELIDGYRNQTSCVSDFSKVIKYYSGTINLCMYSWLMTVNDDCEKYTNENNFSNKRTNFLKEMLRYDVFKYKTNRVVRR